MDIHQFLRFHEKVQVFVLEKCLLFHWKKTNNCRTVPCWTVYLSSPFIKSLRSMMPRLDFNDSHHLARMEKDGLGTAVGLY